MNRVFFHQICCSAAARQRSAHSDVHSSSFNHRGKKAFRVWQTANHRAPSCVTGRVLFFDVWIKWKTETKNWCSSGRKPECQKYRVQSCFNFMNERYFLTKSYGFKISLFLDMFQSGTKYSVFNVNVWKMHCSTEFVYEASFELFMLTKPTVFSVQSLWAGGLNFTGNVNYW